MLQWMSGKEAGSKGVGRTYRLRVAAGPQEQETDRRGEFQVPKEQHLRWRLIIRDVSTL
jgi:hypothetical protein